MVQVLEKKVEAKLDLQNTDFAGRYASITARDDYLSGSVDSQYKFVRETVEAQVGNDWATVTENPANCSGIAQELNPITSSWLRDTGLRPISIPTLLYIREFSQKFYALDPLIALADYINIDITEAITDSADMMIDEASTNNTIHEIFTALTLFDTLGTSVSALAPWLIEVKFNDMKEYSMVRYQIVNTLIINLEKQGKDEIAKKVMLKYLQTIARDMEYYRNHKESLSANFRGDIGRVLTGELRAVSSKLPKLA